MTELRGFPVYQQATDNSCWAATARAVLNYYGAGGGAVYASDQALGIAWQTASPSANPSHADINVQQSAAGALLDLGVNNAMDDAALPTWDEIVQQIDQGFPMLTIISGQPLAPGQARNPAAQQGHWMVIVGYQVIEGQQALIVMDPSYGKDFEYKQFDPAVCGPFPQGTPTQYWQNTSYLDPPAAAGRLETPKSDF